MSSRPAVDVVLPCLNEIEALAWVLERIPPGMSALVVDNGSTDGSVEFATRAGARVVQGKLEANSEFPGQPMEYRVRGGAWTRYTGPVAVRGPVELRTRTMDGRRTSRTVEVGG